MGPEMCIRDSIRDYLDLGRLVSPRGALLIGDEDAVALGAEAVPFRALGAAHVPPPVEVVPARRPRTALTTDLRGQRRQGHAGDGEDGRQRSLPRACQQQDDNDDLDGDERAAEDVGAFLQTSALGTAKASTNRPADAPGDPRTDAFDGIT